jgi:hypothetical protein
VTARGAKKGAPDDATRPERRGGLGSLFAPRPAIDVGMPSIRASLGRGIVTVLSGPLLLVGVPIVLILLWVLLVAAGFQGPFALLVHAFALPPIGTSADVSVAASTFAGSWLIGVAIAIVLRALLLAAVAAAAVQLLRDGATTRWVWVPMLRALPATLAVSFASVSLLLAVQLLSALVGGAGGLGLFVLIGAFVVGINAFAFAPAIGASEDRRLADTLSRSWRAARIPGSGNLSLATLYVVPSFALLFATPALPGGAIGVNPSVGAWVLVILVNLLHVAVTAAYTFRYLSIAEAVPEPAPRPAAQRRR